MKKEHEPIKVTSGRRVKLPKEVCKKLDIDDGDYVIIWMNEDGKTATIAKADIKPKL